ncbi:MAG: T9SS type A sorting domain-containing protein [Candidatus Symbiothrix sp.]|jgi:hypothetical protein|nr:T9SS type A sorting domain-containing protein [Candidatus Symbiothrix sp.]
MKKNHLFLNLILTAVILTAYSPFVQAKDVTSITVKNVTEGTLTLKKKNLQALQIEVLPADADNKSVTYSSSDNQVLTVSAVGEITAAAAGTAIVTIAAQDASGVTANLMVTVTDRTPELSANHPDGPYIHYAATGDKVISVDEEGYIVEKIYPVLPTGYTFETLSDVNEPGKSVRSRFQVTLHPLSRSDWKRAAPDSLIVIADPHAKWAPFISILKAQKVVDANLNWSFGKNELMINGDIFDRGDDATTIFWFTYKLQQEARDAGGEVYFNYGNHEEMVLRNSMSYTNAKYLNLASAYFGTATGTSSQYGSRFFTVNTELGRWLAQCNSVQIIGKDLYVHAGLNPDFYNQNYSIEAVNASMSVEILRSGRGSTSSGLFAVNGDGGILWFRGIVPGYNTSSATPLPLNILGGLLSRYEVERIVIGHTEVSSSSIASANRSDSPKAYSENNYDYRVVNVNVPTDVAYSNGNGRGILVKKNGETYTIYDNKPNTTMSLPQNPIPEGPGDGGDPTGEWEPTYSTPGNEIWYYIQFLTNNLVIQANTVGTLTTAEIPVKDNLNQLWKLEEAGATDVVTISSKQNPAVKLHFMSVSGATSGFFATESAGSYGEPYVLRKAITEGDVSYPALKAAQSRSNAYFAKPQSDTPGAYVARNPNETAAALRENALKFVLPEKLFTGIIAPATSKIKVYPNPADNKLVLENLTDANSIAMLNIVGQTVKPARPIFGFSEEINITELAPGVYFLKIEKTSGVETVKVLVK